RSSVRPSAAPPCHTGPCIGWPTVPSRPRSTTLARSPTAARAARIHGAIGADPGRSRARASANAPPAAPPWVTAISATRTARVCGGAGSRPGEKVPAEVAASRKTRPGVALISPPPHHDIYSIEDLAQVIYNLKQCNPRARVSVKIPAVTDIGTIAVGIAKAGADVIDVSGMEGGTGAASSSSIEHAGLPLERALSEVHQALIINGIRPAVRLRADGGIKTGYDVAVVLALGADEVSLGTALMVAEQCIFCHGCALGNCPAG